MLTPGDDAVAAIVHDWLRQHGHAASADGEPVVPLAWLSAQLDRLTAEVQHDDGLPLGYGRWGKGWDAAVRTIRDLLPSAGT